MRFLKHYVLQGSAATYLRYGEIYNDYFQYFVAIFFDESDSERI